MAPPTTVRGLGPATPRGDAARRLLAARLADLRRHEAPLLEARAEEHVHKMRVATRRLRAALRAFGDGGQLRQVEREVKRLQDALGGVRDLHVQLEWLGKAAPRSKELRGALERLGQLQRRQLPARERALASALRGFGRATVPHLIEAIEKLSLRGRLGGKRMRKRLRRRLGRVVRGMERLAEEMDAQAAHRLRIAVKKLRYDAELLHPAFPHVVDALLEALVPLQALLGELHDADVRLERLEELAARAGPAERDAALALLDRVSEERGGLAARAARELQRWRQEDLGRALKRMLR